MIFFDTRNDEFYFRKPLDICLEFAKRAEKEQLPLGRYELGRGVYGTIAEVAPENKENDLFEAHRKYVDLHYIIRGFQIMKVAFSESLTFCSYSEEKDYVKLTGDAYSTLRVNAGTAVCLFPDDAHGLLVSGSNETVKKIFFKIPVELF